MLEHLTDLDADDFVDLAALNSRELLDASANAAKLLQDLQGGKPVLTQEQLEQARRTFTAMVSPKATEDVRKSAILALKAPQAVRHLSDMLSAYDWEFVSQAREIRGYITAKILEETTHPDARIRLKALQMLGNITEVGAFTERVEITKRDANEEELNARLRAKLQSLLPKVVEVQDVLPKDTTPEERT